MLVCTWPKDYNVFLSLLPYILAISLYGNVIKLIYFGIYYVSDVEATVSLIALSATAISNATKVRFHMLRICYSN